MNPSDDRLSEALRELAATAPQGAPPELGAGVKTAFARHHSRRRRRRNALVAGLAACLLLSLAWFGISKQSPPDTAAKKQPPTSHSAAGPAEVAPNAGAVAAAKILSAHPGSQVRSRATRKIRATGHVEPTNGVVARDFVALPTFDPAVPIGQSRMVRLELPGSSLQLIGYPVDEQLLERRVLTDVLVGQDGLPYAVRLVQTRTVH